MDGRRRKTVHAARRPEERPKDASHSSTFTECTAAMLTLPSFAGPTSARSVTRTVRMRFSVGTGVGPLIAPYGGRRPGKWMGLRLNCVSIRAPARGGCPRGRADRSPADRAAVPPASAPLRRTRAVAHDVEAQFSTVVTPALGAGHPVDRVHRSRVPRGNPRFSPKISEVKATAQQRPAQAPSRH